MKFSRHENFATLPFWQILAPNPCIFLHRGGSQLLVSFKIIQIGPLLSYGHLKLTMFNPTPLGYPPREIRDNFMRANISCYTVITEDPTPPVPNKIYT